MLVHTEQINHRGDQHHPASDAQKTYEDAHTEPQQENDQSHGDLGAANKSLRRGSRALFHLIFYCPGAGGNLQLRDYGNRTFLFFAETVIFTLSLPRSADFLRAGVGHWSKTGVSRN